MATKKYENCVMWDGVSPWIIDNVGTDGRTILHDLSLGQVRTREGNNNIKIVKWDVVEKFIERHNKEFYLDDKAVVVSEEVFEQMIGEMPPCRWMRHGGIEYFHLCEHITDGIVRWYTRTNEGCKTFYGKDDWAEGEIFSKMEDV